MNIPSKGKIVVMSATAALVATSILAGLPDVSGVKMAFRANSEVIKLSSILAVIGGVIWFIANKKLVHLEVIEVGEVGFRVKYGKPVHYPWWRKRRGQRIVYYPGDRVMIIPIIHDIVVASTRLQVDTASCRGVFHGKNIHFDLEIEWHVLDDEESAFRSVFTLHDVVRDDEKNPTLGELVEKRTLRAVDVLLGTLPVDNNGLPVFDAIDLYSPDSRASAKSLFEDTRNECGAVVRRLNAFNRTFAPEERQGPAFVESLGKHSA